MFPGLFADLCRGAVKRDDRSQAACGQSGRSIDIEPDFEEIRPGRLSSLAPEQLREVFRRIDRVLTRRAAAAGTEPGRKGRTPHRRQVF